MVALIFAPKGRFSDSSIVEATTVQQVVN